MLQSAALVQKPSVTSAPASRTGTMERGSPPPVIDSGCKVGGRGAISPDLRFVAGAGNLHILSERRCAISQLANAGMAIISFRRNSVAINSSATPMSM